MYFRRIFFCDYLYRTIFNSMSLIRSIGLPIKQMKSNSNSIYTENEREKESKSEVVRVLTGHSLL